MKSDDNVDNSMNFGQRLKKRLLDLGLVSSLEEFVACTPDEVEQVRIAQKVDFLPRIYREFLLEMGRKASPLMPHHDYSYPYICHAKEWLAEDARISHSEVTLPADAYIMSRHVGDGNYYFHTAAKDENPMVYLYYLHNPQLTIGTLAEWFEEIVQEAVEQREV